MSISPNRIISAALAAALLAGGVALAAPISGAQDGWAAITACAGTPNSDARRDCMDGVLQRAGLLRLTPGDAVPTSRDEAPVRRTLPPPQSEGPKILGLRVPGMSDDRASISTTVARAQIDGEGRLLLVTAEGEAWRSEDGGRQPPKAGRAITIKPQSPGLYECDLGRWDSFLCRRRPG